jgi:hypothetical protein
MEALLELLVEAVFQIFGDLLVELCTRTTNPVLRTIGYCLFYALIGACLAALSLAFHSGHVIQNHSLRLTALCMMPFINGLLMSTVGKYLVRKGRTRSTFDYFAPAFVFSAVFGAVRYFGAR